MSDNFEPMTDDYVTEAQGYPLSLAATPPSSSAFVDPQARESIPSPLETYEGYGMLSIVNRYDGLPFETTH